MKILLLKKKELINFELFEFNFQYLKGLISENIPLYSSNELYVKFKKTYQSSIRNLAKTLHKKQRKGESLFWDILLDKRILIQLLIDPDKALQKINTNIFVYLQYPYINHPVILWKKISNSLLILKELNRIFLFKQPFQILIHYKYINNSKKIYNYFHEDIIAATILIMYLLHNNSFKLLFNKTYRIKFYEPFIYITFDNKSILEKIINPILIDEEKRMQIFSIIPFKIKEQIIKQIYQEVYYSKWKINVNFFNRIDSITFYFYIYNLIMLNKTIIIFIELLLYIPITNATERLFALGKTALLTKDHEKNLGKLLEFLEKIKNAINVINIEEYYPDVGDIYVTFNIKSIKQINMTEYSTITFANIGKRKHIINDEETYKLS